MTVDESIKDLQDAKCYFKSMGCSHFHMAREYPKRYSEYRGLNISQSRESNWTLEEIELLLGRLKEDSTPRKELWSAHSHVTTLILNGKFNDQLPPLLIGTMAVEERLKSKLDRLLVAETIVGRQDIRYRPGPIFRSQEFGDGDLATDFAILANILTERPFGKPQDEGRRQKLLDALSKTCSACGIAELSPIEYCQQNDAPNGASANGRS